MAAPTVTSLTPSTGVASGGTTVLVAGTGFTGVTAVQFGGISADFEVSGTTLLAATAPVHAAGAVTVTVTNADGTSTDVVTFTYSGSALFTVAEARAFRQGELVDGSLYPTATIEAVEVGIHDWFYRNLGVRFAPYTETDVYRDGTGTRELWVLQHRLLSVTACTIYDSDGTVSETFDADDLADLAVYGEGKILRRQNGTFLAGDRNIKLTFTHGYSAVPYMVKKAALVLLHKELINTDVPNTITQMSDGTMHYSFSVAGRGRTEWNGIPEVDTVFRTYNENIGGVA